MAVVGLPPPQARLTEPFMQLSWPLIRGARKWTPGRVKPLRGYAPFCSQLLAVIVQVDPSGIRHTPWFPGTG